MTAHWDADVIATILKKYVTDHNIDTVCHIPFMSGSISIMNTLI